MTDDRNQQQQPPPQQQQPFDFETSALPFGTAPLVDVRGSLMAPAIATVVYHTIGLISGVLIFLGAISMLSLKRYSLAVAASVLSMMPATSGCCLVGLPIGIWALVTLSRPGVSAAFRS